MRRLAAICGGFAAGTFLAQYLLPWAWQLSAGLLCVGLGLLALFLPPKWRKRSVLCLVGAALALGWNWLYVRQVSAPMERKAGTQEVMTMTLLAYPEETSYGAKAVVKVDGFPGKVTYYGETALLDLCPGQRVTEEVSLQSASRIRDNDVTAFNSKGIFLLAFSRGTPVYGGGEPMSPRWWPARLGHTLQAQIRTLFSGDDAGFLLALLTGRKGELSIQADIDLSEAGIYHVLAVSGMHCAYLLAVIVFLTGRHRRRLTAAAAIPTLLFYAVLAGASPSVTRACVMLSFLLAAPLFRRENDPPTALLTALCLILLNNPFAAKSISLQLSFGAVMGLLWLTPRIYRRLLGGRVHGRVFRAAAGSVSATVGALALTAPFTAYYFGTFALVGFLSNLLCLWVVGIAFVSGLAAVLLSFLWMPLGTVLGFLPRVCIRYILAVCHGLAALPHHTVYFCGDYLKYWMVFVYVLFAAAWLLGPKNGLRRFVMAAGLSAAALAGTLRLESVRYDHRLDIWAMDAGQGQCVILRSGGQTALVDCGSGSSWYDAGCDAADRIMSMGCRSVDRVILTHFDDDHINGVAHLMARLPVDMLTVPLTTENSSGRDSILALAAQYGTAVETVTEETALSLGEAALTVFPPLGNGGSNELGLTVLAAVEENELLITGDMDQATEKKLIAAYDLPDIEILIAGHHGSKGSTSKELLKAVTPETAVISVGSNRYGHPAAETLDRLARAECAIYRTDRHGTIHMMFD